MRFPSATVPLTPLSNPNPQPTSQSTQESKMAAPTTSALTLSILTSLGGTIGYLRTGSLPSVIAGVSVGALYLLSFLRLRSGQPYAEEIGLLASIVLGGASIPRAIRLRKPVPLVLSVLAVYGLFVFGGAMLGKRA
ncbi:transmembrane proteins 14C-domain-containing protein [Aspergillus keveii]|uniref:Transmembrane proteins 14C-domain-containing protein n=1 Tax=Aspergillus keveii TaxID=714993 RepID=A0ABR4GJY4_9EURO